MSSAVKGEEPSRTYPPLVPRHSSRAIDRTASAVEHRSTGRGKKTPSFQVFDQAKECRIVPDHKALFGPTWAAEGGCADSFNEHWNEHFAACATRRPRRPDKPTINHATKRTRRSRRFDNLFRAMCEQPGAASKESPMDLRFRHWLIIVACMIAGGARLASAADVVSYPVKAIPLANSVPNWAGFYVGGQLGYGRDSVRWHNLGPSGFFSPAGSITRDRGSGIIGGGQAGYNFQYNRVVLGIEGSMSAAGFDRTFASPYFPATDAWSSRLNWLGTVTGRVGIALDGGWLPYVKGGFATGNLDTRLQSTVAGVSVDGSATHHGWTAGGGVEVKVAPKFSLGLEYMYTDLGRRNDINGPLTAGGAPVAGTSESYGVGAKSQSIMTRFNFLFGGR